MVFFDDQTGNIRNAEAIGVTSVPHEVLRRSGQNITRQKSQKWISASARKGGLCAGTADFFDKIRVLSDRDPGTILNWLGGRWGRHAYVK